MDSSNQLEPVSPAQASKNKFRTIFRCFSDCQNYQELLSSLGVRLSEASIFEFGIAAHKQCDRRFLDTVLIVNSVRYAVTNTPYW